MASIEPMKTVGLTGTIAAGKSFVSSILRDLGAAIIDTDAIAREVVEPGTAGNQMIRAAFGDLVFLHDGGLDRRALGEVVFADADKLKQLNAILHPLIIEESFHRAEKARRDGFPLAVIDAPLLIESDMHTKVDAVLLVVADDEICLRRIQERDGLNEEQARNRIAAQMPQGNKRDFADYVIDNSGSPERTRRQVESLFRRLAAD